MESRERGIVRDFRDLLVWRRAMDIARVVYGIVEHFPAREQYGLVSQICRSAVSIASNIAEGHGRETPGDFARFLRIARGSLAELQTQLILSEQIGFLTKNQTEPLVDQLDELGRMLRGLQRTLDS